MRQPNETTLSQIVPPDAWRNGDLSSVATAIRNPATGQPFPGNRIPVNPVSARVLDLFYERQNQATGSAIDRPNFIVNAPGEFTVDGLDGRGDYVLSPSQKMFAPTTARRTSTSAGRPGNWNTKQGDSFKRTEVRQIAGSHNWAAGSLLNEIRGGWSNTVEKDSYTNATQGADLIAQAGLDRIAAVAGKRRVPGIPFRRRVVHPDGRGQAVQHPVARRARQRNVDVGQGRARDEGRRRRPVRRIQGSDFVLRRRRVRPLRIRRVLSPGTPSPTSSSACRARPATSCRRPT